MTVDIDRLEELADQYTRYASRVEEILLLLRNVRDEIKQEALLTEDTQAEAASGALDRAVSKLTGEVETAKSLQTLLAAFPEECRQLETEHKNALQKLDAYMQSVLQAYADVIAPGNEEDDLSSETRTNPEALQELVLSDVTDMEMINISAITGILSEEYDIEDVRELP